MVNGGDSLGGSSFYSNNNKSPTTAPVVLPSQHRPHSSVALNVARQTIMGRLAAATAGAAPNSNHHHVFHTNSYTSIPNYTNNTPQNHTNRHSLAPQSLRQLHHMSMPPFASAVTNATNNATATTFNHTPTNSSTSSLINHFNNNASSMNANSTPKPFYNAPSSSLGWLKCKFSCRSFVGWFLSLVRYFFDTINSYSFLFPNWKLTVFPIPITIFGLLLTTTTVNVFLSKN